MEYQIILGAVATIVGLSGYLPYFKDLIKGSIKPHMFSWLVWGLAEGLSAYGSFIKGGGAGTWFSGAGACLCFVVFFISISRGEKRITRLDCIGLGGALAGIVIWIATSNPLGAVVMAAMVDSLGFIPTFRKSYSKPGEEAISIYLTSFFGFGISLLALQAVNLTTVLYPAVATITAGALVVFILIRRSRPGKT